MSELPPLPTPQQLRERLDALRASRGFLLPHHGALAAAAPDLHEAYGRMYAALTLTERHLDPFEKEFVWLAILTATRETIGTHHLDLFRRAGGTDEVARVAFRLAGYAGAADAFALVGEHWRSWFPGIDPVADYLAGARALCAEVVAPDLADLALLAVHAASARDWGVAAHLRSAYAARIPEVKLVEALALVIWPTGVNRFLEACTIWHGMMVAGQVTPSELFRAWAETPGQGAFAPEADGR